MFIDVIFTEQCWIRADLLYQAERQTNKHQHSPVSTLYSTLHLVFYSLVSGVSAVSPLHFCSIPVCIQDIS